MLVMGAAGRPIWMVPPARWAGFCISPSSAATCPMRLSAVHSAKGLPPDVGVRRACTRRAEPIYAGNVVPASALAQAGRDIDHATEGHLAHERQTDIARRRRPAARNDRACPKLDPQQHRARAAHAGPRLGPGTARSLGLCARSADAAEG